MGRRLNFQNGWMAFNSLSQFPYAHVAGICRPKHPRTHPVQGAYSPLQPVGVDFIVSFVFILTATLNMDVQPLNIRALFGALSFIVFLLLLLLHM